MAKATFTGRLDFGLVAIPVKAYPVAVEKETTWHYLHRPCLAPIKDERVCQQCGKKVLPEESAKGIEHDGRWVVLDKEDLEQLTPEPETGRPLTIRCTLPQNTVPDLWYNKSYYLVPESVGVERAYSLLSRALREERRVAVVTFVVYAKTRMGILHVGEHSLILRTLIYANYMRNLDTYGVEIAKTQLTTREIASARLLVQRLGRQPVLMPDQNIDDYPQRIIALVDAKLKGAPLPKGVVALPVESPKVIDLRAALHASLKQVAQRQKPQPRRQEAQRHRKAK